MRMRDDGKWCFTFYCNNIIDYIENIKIKKMNISFIKSIYAQVLNFQYGDHIGFVLSK